MAAQAWFSRGDIEVVPGTSAVFQLTIVNLGDTTETFSLAPVGLAAGWTTIRPGSVTLFGGSQEVVDVEVQPPLLPPPRQGRRRSPCGSCRRATQTMSDRRRPRCRSAPTYTRRLHMLQPALRARRKAIYEMMLENQGNTQASCRLHLLDPTGRIDGDFDPPAAGVEPGASTLIRLKVHANRLQWERRSRTVQFTIDADQPGCPTASAPVTFVQASMIPERLFGRLLAAWRTCRSAGWRVVRSGQAGDPRRRRRRRRRAAAEGHLVDLGRRRPPWSPATRRPSPPPSPAAGVDEGELFSQVLAPRHPPGRPPRSPLEVPAGSTLRITDIALQNPDKDSGLPCCSTGTRRSTRSRWPM